MSLFGRREGKEAMYNKNDNVLRKSNGIMLRGRKSLLFNSSERHFNKVNASEPTDMNLDRNQTCSAEDTLAVNTGLLMLSHK